jgi:hypothetical protein
MRDAFDEACRIAENKGRAFSDFISLNGYTRKTIPHLSLIAIKT